MSVAAVDVRSDGQGAYIDLTRRNIQVDDIEAKKRQFERTKVVHLIMRLTAAQLKCKLIDIYEEWGWDFYDQFS
jgi:translation initiation factor 2 alpha subunit (eIF-2alpha)